MTSSARRRAWAPPLRRRLPGAALLATLALLAAPLLPVGAVPSAPAVRPPGMPLPVASAVEDGEGLRVVLDEVDPVVLRPDRPARLSGRVLNPAPVPARLGGVTLSASTSLLGSRKEVADWVDGGIDRSTTWVLGDDTIGPLVPAEGEVAFSVVVPADELASLPDGPAALAVRLSAEVEGDGEPVSSGDGTGGDLAELRTVLTSSGGRLVGTPMEVSWLVPLTLPPDPGLTDPDPARHAQAWTDAVGEGSPVRGWLDHLTLPDVTWLVDPALLVAPRPLPSVASPAPAPEEPEETGDPEETGEPSDPGTTGEPADPGTTAEPTDPAPADAPEDTGTAPTPAGTTTSGGSAGSAPATPTLAATPAAPGDSTGRTGSAPTPDQATGTTGPAAPPDDPPVTEQPPEEQTPPDEGPPDEQDVERALGELRDRLARVPAQERWWLPAGDPDLARLVADGLTPPPDTVQTLLTRAPAEDAPDAVARLLRGGRTGVLWPALPGPTTSDLFRMVGLHDSAPSVPAPEVVVVPRESFTASSAAGPRRGAALVEDTDLTAVGVDSWTTALVAAGAEAAQDTGAGAAAQRLLAHTLGSWLEAPTSRRELVVAPPRGTTPAPEVLDQLVRAWPDADWLTTLPAEEVLTRAQEQEAVTLSGTAPQESVLGALAPLLLPEPSPVDASRGRDLVGLDDDLDGLGEILRDTTALRSWRPVLADLWSTRWREAPAAWPTTFRTLRGDVRQAREAVHIAPSNVNFIADQGVIQVTVVNDLPVAVDDVQLAVSTTNGRLQVLRQPDPVSVGPGSRAAVPFEARAVTRGEVTLHVELTTPDGTELGVDEEIAVRVQPTGVWIYWVLGGLAGVVLILGLVRALPGPPRVPRSGPSDAAYPDPGPETQTQTDTGQEERQ